MRFDFPDYDSTNLRRAQAAAIDFSKVYGMIGVPIIAKEDDSNE